MILGFEEQAAIVISINMQRTSGGTMIPPPTRMQTLSHLWIERTRKRYTVVAARIPSTTRISRNGKQKTTNSVILIVGLTVVPSILEAPYKWLLEPHDVISAIHVNDFAGDAAAGVGGEEDSGRADFCNIDIAAERGVFGVGLQHVAEA